MGRDNNWRVSLPAYIHTRSYTHILIHKYTQTNTHTHIHTYTKGTPNKAAYDSYRLVCGAGDVPGDGVVPLQSAHLDGATQITVQVPEYFYVCMHVCTNISMYVCMYVFIVCVYVYVSVLGDGVVPLQSANLDGAMEWLR